MAKKSKNVALATMVDPVAITLVEKPANQVAFRVVRGENGEEVSVPVKRVRRQRSESRSAFLHISFPPGTSRDEVEAEAKDFGIEGYEINETEDGGIVLRRQDAPEGDMPTISVNLGNGRSLTMLRTDVQGDQQSVKEDGLKLISISLDKEVFRSDDEAKSFLSQKAIDIADWANENTDTHYVFTRSSEGSVGSAGKIEVEDGVVVEVVRAEVNDVPSSIAEVVSEAAYGSWGWGQLDFAASLMDVEFCNLTDRAIYKFRDVVENIMFYSRLPLAARKELIYRAAAQFALYLGNLLDGLPAGVVLVNRSSNQKKESEMTDKANQTQKQDDNAGTASADNAAAPEYLTRADAQAMITEAVAAAIAAAKAPEAGEDKQVTRSEDEKKEEQKEDPTLSALQVLTRSVEALTQSVSAVNERVGGLESTTIVRSDAGDAPTKTETKKRDVFAGVLSRSQGS